MENVSENYDSAEFGAEISRLAEKFATFGNELKKLHGVNTTFFGMYGALFSPVVGKALSEIWTEKIENDLGDFFTAYDSWIAQARAEKVLKDEFVLDERSYYELATQYAYTGADVDFNVESEKSQSVSILGYTDEMLEAEKLLSDSRKDAILADFMSGNKSLSGYTEEEKLYYRSLGVASLYDGFKDVSQKYTDSKVVVEDWLTVQGFGEQEIEDLFGETGACSTLNNRALLDQIIEGASYLSHEEILGLMNENAKCQVLSGLESVVGSLFESGNQTGNSADVAYTGGLGGYTGVSFQQFTNDADSSDSSIDALNLLLDGVFGIATSNGSSSSMPFNSPLNVNKDFRTSR